IWSFNGAASITRRKVDHPKVMLEVIEKLQRGRLHHEAEGNRSIPSSRGTVVLQRGRLDHEAEGLPASGRPRRCWEGFNGAASITRRKGGRPALVAHRHGRASTGPPRSRGGRRGKHHG